MPELLLPAGNFEKLKAAILYGADAVYCAGQMFGMRAAADNFTVEELYEAAAYVHARGKKIYLTVNTMPHVQEYPLLCKFLEGEGKGLALLPKAFFELQGSKHVTSVPLKEKAYRVLALAWKKDKKLDPAEKEFIEFTKEWFKKV